MEVAFSAANIDGRWIKIDDTPESEVFVSGKNVLVRINPLFYRPAEVDILLGSSELARKELGWNPRIDLRELVDRMVHNDLIIVG